MKADISHLVSLVFRAVCVSSLMLSRGHLGALPTFSCFLPICLCPTGCLIPDLLSPSASRLPSGVLTNKPLLSHLMLAFIWGYLFFHGVMDEAHYHISPCEDMHGIFPLLSKVLLIMLATQLQMLSNTKYSPVSKTGPCSLLSPGHTGNVKW